jgi:hypothetical protein
VVAWWKVLAKREMTVERRQARVKQVPASAGGTVRAHTVSYRASKSTLAVAVASLVVLALYCFVAGADVCPIHHVRPLRQSVQVP